VDCSSNILVACALKKESEALKRFLNPGYKVITTGLGVDRTLQTLETVFETNPPLLLLFTGMGGQLDPSLKLGDFVFPERWGYESGTEFQVDNTISEILKKEGWKIEGKGITVRKPVVREKHRLRLFKESGARICDMESAGALMISSSYGVPCIAPKIISDTAESGMLAFYRNFGMNVELLGGHISKLVDSLESSIPLLWEANSCGPNCHC
jgi:nucleoside phosphorylase